MACVSGRLTTHVLDTAAGRPAAGVRVELWRDGALVAAAMTNADGRTDAPLTDALEVGGYELRFAVGRTSRRPVWRRTRRSWTSSRSPSASPTPAAHHHVPLLVAPWSYSTYRGS